MALNILKNYFYELVDQKVKYRGSNKRKFFCKMNKEKLKQFDFNFMFQEIMDSYNDMRNQMNDSYK